MAGIAETRLQCIYGRRKEDGCFEIWEQVFPKRALPDRPFTSLYPSEMEILSPEFIKVSKMLRLGWIEQMPRILAFNPKSLPQSTVLVNGTEKIHRSVHRHLLIVFRSIFRETESALFVLHSKQRRLYCRPG
jgi:hypothetical protein